MTKMDKDTIKGIFMLLARRAATTLAAILVAHGAVDAGQQGASVEIITGIIVWLGEIGLEWWRKFGMVLVSKQVAKMKGIPLPHQDPVIARPIVGAAPILIKSVVA